MSEKKIKTTGQLRDFIVTAMVEVKSGSMELETASRITKLASQVNESIYAEIKVSKILAEQGVSPNKLGDMPLS